MADVASVLVRQQPGAVTPPPPDGEYHIKPSMSAAEVTAAVNARGKGAVVTWAPGIHHPPTIVPLDGQRHLGNPAKRGEHTLEGDAQNKRAFAGHAVDVTIEGMTIQHYASGGPTNLAAGACGSNRGAWIFKLAAICPQTLDPQSGAGGPPAKAWTIKDCHIREIYAEGINYCDDMRILATEIDNCGSCGASGFATRVTIDGCNVHHNSRWQWNARDHSSGVKIQCGYGATHAAMRGHKVLRCNIHDNWGDSIWCDYNGWDNEFAWNSLWNNTHDQLHLEAWSDAWCHHNQLGLGGGSLGGTLQGTFLIQNAKHSRFEDNLIVVSCGSACWILQHNEINRPNISDRHVGLFGSCHNSIKRNSWLMLNPAASFKIDFQPTSGFSGDPNCTGFLVPAAPDAIDPRGHNFCFFAHSIKDMATVIEGNTYRFPAAGQAPVRLSWPVETNAKIIAPGDPQKFVPADWNKPPTWTTPPGL